MSFHYPLLSIVTNTGSSPMVACGENSGGSCGYSYWHGSFGGCIAPVIITGDGEIAGQDGTCCRLNVSVPANNVTGPYFGLSQRAIFPNGTQATSGSISAVASPNLTGNLTDLTSAIESLAFNFDTVYNLGSSLATLAGTWSYTANGFSLTATIRPDGTFSAIDSNRSTYSGAFRLIDPKFNAYGESYARSRNGVSVTLTGSATYFPPVGNTATADIKVLADDNTSEFRVADFQ